MVASVDIGLLRPNERNFQQDPPTREEVRRAHEVISEAFDDLTPPLPLGALAVGGTARALRRVAGSRLGASEIEAATEELLRRPSRQVAKAFKLDGQRARTIVAGALILGEIQRRLTVPLEVGRGGLREGAALMLLDATVAATA